MKGLPLIIVSCLLFAACEKKGARVLVEETRRATTRDGEPRLFATSDERFRDTKPSPVKGKPPENWLALPSTQFRVLNYRFGESGIGEVYVSLSTGSVMDNVNRWLKQFGRDSLGPVDFAAMETLSLAGTEGVWVEAAGSYGSGMGAEAKPGYGLAGVVADVGGQILTVKMIGPEAEVESEKKQLRDYIASLEMAGN